MTKGTASYPCLTGKAVFITGGASGIGADLVRAFLEQGAVVGFVDYDADSAAALQEAMADKGLAQPWFRKVDVTEIESLQGAISDFAELSGGLHTLINNAANDMRHNPLETTPDVWRRCLAINLDSVFFACQTAIEIMQKGDGGRIVNLSSINALFGPPNMPGYVAAKAAINAITKALAGQYGKAGIRVNSVLPGWVITDRQLELWLTPEEEDAWMKEVALQERLMPRDVSSLIVFLSSDEGRMITGQQLVIDGGRT